METVEIKTDSFTKPHIVFTTFWDAQSLMEQAKKYGHFVFENDEEPIFLQTPNVTTYSIALKQPEGMKFEELPFLFPTYEMLKDYKQNKDWDIYKPRYLALLKNRLSLLTKWLDLEMEKKKNLLILCCWENTANGANCHRRIVYDAIARSVKYKDKIVMVYRHGNELMRERVLQKKKNMPEYTLEMKIALEMKIDGNGDIF